MIRDASMMTKEILRTGGAKKIRRNLCAGQLQSSFNSMQFNPVDTIHINGDATQGENIADLGGLLLGLDAFKKTKPSKKIKRLAA